MKVLRTLAFTCLILSPAFEAAGQVDEICKEFGYMATLDGPRLAAPYLYGKIAVVASTPVSEFPKITVTYLNRSQSPARLLVERSGNYCFRLSGSGGGTLSIEIDGTEVARRVIPEFGPAQKREDFQVSIPGHGTNQAPPGVVSLKFNYPPNEKTAELYKAAAKAESAQDLKAAVATMKQVVAIDPNDFIAWAQLGTLQFRDNLFLDANASYRRSLALREDYTPAWINVGKLRVAQKQYLAAIEIFKYAADLDPEDARIFRLLGEAYLQNRQGTLGAESLNQALKLAPIGQAECHLQLAHLYQLAGAKEMAAAEYKKFLEKVPNHPDRKKFEKFIDANQPKS